MHIHGTLIVSTSTVIRYNAIEIFSINTHKVKSRHPKIHLLHHFALDLIVLAVFAVAVG